MRDVNRIDPILEALGKAWKLYPDMRLGQLISVIAGQSPNYIFGIEDEEMLKCIEKYIAEMIEGRKKANLPVPDINNSW